MRYVAIWVPRSITHLREIDDILRNSEMAERVSDVRYESTTTDTSPDRRDGRDGMVTFSVERDTGETLRCRFTQIGLLVVEADSESAEDDLRSEAKQIYTELADQEWTVLAEQLACKRIPFGEASLSLDEFDMRAVYEAVCNDYLANCVRRSRDYESSTQSEEITDLLQRIKQAEACHEYVAEIYDLENPSLQQHLSYTKNLIEMSYQNINIKSQRHREEQLRRIEIIALAFTVIVVFINVMQFL